MVSFVDYINEAMAKNIEGVLEKLRKDCAPFLKEIKGTKNLLWRGVNKQMGPKSLIVKRRRRKRRRPLSTDPKLHLKLDKLFQEKFGWKARSQGVFATPVESSAKFFSFFKGIEGGSAYLFFPIGSYRYIWNPDIGDLYSKVSNSMDNDRMQSVIGGYIKKDLKKAMSLHSFVEREIMFDVDNYYLVQGKYEAQLKDALL